MKCVHHSTDQPECQVVCCLHNLLLIMLSHIASPCMLSRYVESSPGAEDTIIMGMSFGNLSMISVIDARCPAFASAIN